jgi:hypothetical protein
MEQKQMFKQMIDFNRAAFENTFNAMTTIQNQTEQMVQMFIDGSWGMPEESKKLMQEWLNAYRKGRENFKALMDENFNRLESFLSETPKTEKSKAEEAPKAQKAPKTEKAS